MLAMLIIAGLICMVDKTGFLCDERLTNLLYIKDENEEVKVPPQKETDKETKLDLTKSEPEDKNANKQDTVLNLKKDNTVEKNINVIEDKKPINNSPLDDLDELNDFGDFGDFSGFNFREPGSSNVKPNENSINTDAIFGDFKDEDDIPLMTDLDDIAASILSDIYGGVY